MFKQCQVKRTKRAVWKHVKNFNMTKGHVSLRLLVALQLVARDEQAEHGCAETNGPLTLEVASHVHLHLTEYRFECGDDIFGLDSGAPPSDQPTILAQKVPEPRVSCWPHPSRSPDVL